MNLSKEQVIAKIESLITEGNAILKTTRPNTGHWLDYDVYLPWHTRALAFIKLFLPDENPYVIEFSDRIAYNAVTAGHVNTCTQFLRNIKEDIENGFISLESKTPTTDASAILDNLFSKFHKVVQQLCARYKNRPAFVDIIDEYDVQDLLHSLLRLHFDDIRREERVPSHAGGSSTMDFLLKKEKIGIEVKKTREGLTAGKLGEELIIDIEKYQKHLECKHLVCFVYDPESKLKNPIGIMDDLNKQHGGFVKVIIEP